jgi:DNA-binding SARP family transcriptional activator
MDDVCVCLFGKLELRYGGQLISGLEGCKAQELFSYLLLYRDRPHSRETLADLLWGTTSTSQSKSYLRKTLWQIQSTLEGPSQGRSHSILLVEPEWVQVNPGAALWLDVDVFERAFALVKGRPGRELGVRSIQALHRAVEVYRGDLLEGCYQDWCIYERERLQHLFLIILEKLMGYSEAHQQFEVGQTFATRILRYDRARERTHRRLMRLYYLAGDRTSALRQFQRCAEALDEELGVRPSKRTLALYQQICADHMEDVVLGGESIHETAVPTLPAVLTRLRQLHGLLAEAQNQVLQDIQVVEAALNGRP